MRANCTQAAQGRGIKRYPEDEPREALRLVMQQPQARRIFNERKAIVELFSSLRCQQGLNRFRRRGLQAVKREFALHVLAHNLSRAVVLRALLTFLYVVLRHRYELAHEFLALLVHASNPINARTSVGCRTANAVLRQPLKGEDCRASVQSPEGSGAAASKRSTKKSINALARADWFFLFE